MGKLDTLRQFRRTFTGRMVLGLFVIQLILTPALFYGVLQYISDSLESLFVDQVRGKARLYSTLMTDALLDGDLSAQIEVLNEAMINEEMLHADLVLPNGGIISSEFEVWYLDRDFLEDFEFGMNGDTIYNISVPIWDQLMDDPLGTLRLSFDESVTIQRVEAAYRIGILIALGYAALSILIAVVLGRRLTRPVKQLQLAAQGIARGDESFALNVDEDIREIDQLAKDLDFMRQNLLERRQAVHDRERRLFTILDNAGEGIISVEESGQIGSFNKAAEQIFGYSSEEAQGLDIEQLFPMNGSEGPDTLERLGDTDRVSARHQNGQVIPVLVTLSDIQREGEHVFVLIVRDLTSEVEREKRLLTFWQVMEQSPIGIIITDTRGSIEYANPHFCKVTGYGAQEVMGLNPRFLRTEYTSRDTYKDLWSTITSGFVWRGVFQNRKKNGDLFWESDTICPVRDADGRIAHYIALKEDITEHRERDRMLTHAMKMDVVGRMTSGIAHDFNNLLTIIRGNLDILEEDLQPDDPLDLMELVTDAKSAAIDGANLIKQLLIFSRREDPDVRPVEMGEFVKSLQPLLKRTVPSNVELVQDFQDQPGTVVVDANRLESAVLNLVINARDAMPIGGRLTLRLKGHELAHSEPVEGGLISAGRYVFLEVADTGTGMSEEVRQKALEPFFTTKPGTSGTGLGLSMVNDLITQYEGGIRIDTRQDEGTLITLILPLSEADQPLDARWAKTGDPRHRGLPRGSETILVVEDRSRVRQFAQRTLTRLGYRVLEAADAGEALQQLDSHPDVDMLFTDIVMPGDMNGRDLAQEVAEHHPVIKILLTTGMEMRQDSGPTLDFPLLSKPYSAEELATAIRNILKHGSLLT